MKRGSLSISTSMWLALAIAAAITPVSWGQTRATLTGRVTDATGAVVPGTKLTLPYAYKFASGLIPSWSFELNIDSVSNVSVENVV